MTLSTIDFDALWRHVLTEAKPDAHSIHGPDHWRRVERNGVYLAREIGANIDIVRLFALFHDSCRENEHYDPGHGRRGAAYAAKLHGRFFTLDAAALECLVYACAYHTDKTHAEDITVGACWDADRLDLRRVYITPDAAYLNTTPAKRIVMTDDFAAIDAFRFDGDFVA